MSASAVIRALLVASMVVLSACGGGEQDDDWDIAGALFDGLWEAAFGSSNTPPALSISEPSSGAYETSAAVLRIGGTTSDPDADIIWTSSAGGGGDTAPDWELCLFSCAYDWSFTVPLAVGHNLITIVASGEGGETVTTITITRYAPPAQWSWAR